MKKNLKVFFALVCLLLILAPATNSDVSKRVLFENWTSSTCGPCASNNPQLKQWMSDNWGYLVCVSYHVGWPPPGNDPMYLHNPTQSYDRRYYYGINSVPAAYMQGIHYYVGSPFPFSNMTIYVNYYTGLSTPTGLSVTDVRIPGDTIKATVVLTNFSALPAGNYALRVMAVERQILYSSPPGTNGETDFRNVFRKALPNSTGTQIPLTAGTYNYEFKYKRDAVWNDTSVYTIAFIQNDNDKTIMNASRMGILSALPPYSNEIPSNFSLRQNFPNPFNPNTQIGFNLPTDEYVTLKVYDMLGNEIGTLVNGRQKAGMYNVDFYGSDLASGIYFYTLKAGNFTDTKKMILVK